MKISEARKRLTSLGYTDLSVLREPGGLWRARVCYTDRGTVYTSSYGVTRRDTLEHLVRFLEALSRAAG